MTIFLYQSLSEPSPYPLSSDTHRTFFQPQKYLHALLLWSKQCLSQPGEKRMDQQDITQNQDSSYEWSNTNVMSAKRASDRTDYDSFVLPHQTGLRILGTNAYRTDYDSFVLPYQTGPHILGVNA